MNILDGELQSVVLALALRFGAALLIVLVGRWLAKMAKRWMAKVLAKTTLTESLADVTVKFTYYSVLGAAALTALSVLGVPTTALVAFIGVVIVILGIALQESLGNFAATVIFLLFEPYRVGDLIETGRVVGTVHEIQIFDTVIHCADRKVVVLPNGKIQAEGVTNYSKQPILRVDIEIGISYRDDIQSAKRIALEVVCENALVLEDPPPQIIVLELGDSSVKLGIARSPEARNIGIYSGSCQSNSRLAFSARASPSPTHSARSISCQSSRLDGLALHNDSPASGHQIACWRRDRRDTPGAEDKPPPLRCIQCGFGLVAHAFRRAAHHRLPLAQSAAQNLVRLQTCVCQCGRGLPVVPVHHLCWIVGDQVKHDIGAMKVKHVEPHVTGSVEYLQVMR
ncbi:MAG: mechanosensitive ion channel family protein [Caldilineaceae bacterium]|nr:mechanosensitive ion channel family protein [Caldilineaceae bacterium]